MAFRAEPSVWGRLEVSFAAGASTSTEWGQLFVEASPSAGAAGRHPAQFWEQGAAVGEGEIGFGAARGMPLSGALAFG